LLEKALALGYSAKQRPDFARLGSVGSL